MAWTAPRTWVTGETPTAAIFNTHVRDQFLEFDSVTTGSYLVSDGTAPVWRVASWDNGDATYTSTSSPPTSYTALDAAGWGSGEAVDVTVTTGTDAIVFYGARSVAHNDTTTSVDFSIDVSGATTAAASDARSTSVEGSAAGDANGFTGFTLYTALTAGSNVFELVAKATYSGSPTITIRYPRILVMAL